MDEPTELIDHLPLEALLFGSISLIITYFRLWKTIGSNVQINTGKQYVFIALAFPLLVLFSTILLTLLSGQTVDLAFSLSLGNILLLFVMTVLIGAFEELLFRGVLQNGLAQSLGPIKAVFLTALLFGLAHYTNWINGKPFLETSGQVFDAFFAGLLLGALKLVTKSIWPCILVHSLWDFFVFGYSAVESSLPSTRDGALFIPGTILALILFAKPLFGLYLIANYWKENRKQVAPSKTTLHEEPSD